MNTSTSIETDDYVVCANPRRAFWQKKRLKWLVVGYYWNDADSGAAREAAQRRADYVAHHLTQLPTEIKVYQRQEWPEEIEGS